MLFGLVSTLLIVARVNIAGASAGITLSWLGMLVLFILLMDLSKRLSNIPPLESGEVIAEGTSLFCKFIICLGTTLLEVVVQLLEPLRLFRDLLSFFRPPD